MKEFRGVMKLLWVKETVTMFLCYMASLAFIGLGVAMSQSEEGDVVLIVMFYAVGFGYAVIGWSVGRWGTRK